MKEKELNIDFSCHVLYSKKCEKEVKKSIALHYPSEEREGVFEAFQKKYVEFLSDWRKDLGGKKNFHNGIGGTYDNIALMTYYVVAHGVVTTKEIGEMLENIFLPSFKKLRFVNYNKHCWKKPMYMAFAKAKSRCDKWGDYDMRIDPYDKKEPTHYEFHSCPVAEFAKKHGLNEVMPALCNIDYRAMECLHVKLVRKNTCSNGDKCDYTFYGDKDERLKGHEEYVDEEGYRRNE